MAQIWLKRQWWLAPSRIEWIRFYANLTLDSTKHDRSPCFTCRDLTYWIDSFEPESSQMWFTTRDSSTTRLCFIVFNRFKLPRSCLQPRNDASSGHIPPMTLVHTSLHRWRTSRRALVLWQCLARPQPPYSGQSDETWDVSQKWHGEFENIGLESHILHLHAQISVRKPLTHKKSPKSFQRSSMRGSFPGTDCDKLLHVA